MNTKAKLVVVAGFILISLGVLTARGDDVEQGGDQIARDPAYTGQIFSPEYLERINTERQASDAQAKEDRVRHEKMLDFYLRR